MDEGTHVAGLVAPREAVGLAAEVLAADVGLSEQSLDRFVDLMGRFADFLVTGHGVDDLAAVGEELARSFVVAPTTELAAPSPSTMHFRRSAVRMLFRVARRLEVAESDPTLDLRLPPRSGLCCRPLTDDELALCRAVSVHSLDATRLPAAWALAEATARTSELPAVTVSDVDLEHGRVWLHSGSKTRPRWGELSGWGVVQLRRRMDRLGGDPAALLVYEGDGSAQSRQASACIAISMTLARAGLGNERDVRPASVPAWAGRRILVERGRIDVVADRLGMRSLDAAARFVRLDRRRGDGC